MHSDWNRSCVHSCFNSENFLSDAFEYTTHRAKGSSKWGWVLHGHQFKCQNLTICLKFAGPKQERPAHLRPETIHPAMRERGRTIPPHPQLTVPIVDRIEHRPGSPPGVHGVPGPGMRMAALGATHQSQKTAGGLNSIVMPIYTVGIVAFFVYTIVKVRFFSVWKFSFCRHSNGIFLAISLLCPPLNDFLYFFCSLFLDFNEKFFQK